MSIEEKVKELLKGILDVEGNAVVPEASLVADLRVSSIDLVEIVTALENAFRIRISDEEARGLRTVQTLIDLLEKKIR